MESGYDMAPHVAVRQAGDDPPRGEDLSCQGL